MPAKKSAPARAKLKSKAKPRAKAPSQKKAKLKVVQPEKHPFWRLLEAKKQQHKEHQEQQGHHHVDRDSQKAFEYRHQAKYARFAGPRRRAA